MTALPPLACSESYFMSAVDNHGAHVTLNISPKISSVPNLSSGYRNKSSLYALFNKTTVWLPVELCITIS